MISDRAKRLVEALMSWRSLELAYETAQAFLDAERTEALSDAASLSGYTYLTGIGRGDDLSARIAQTRGHNGEPE